MVLWFVVEIDPEGSDEKPGALGINQIYHERNPRVDETRSGRPKNR
jgi:hypothetical protein